MIVAVADTHAIIWHTYGDRRLSTVAHTFMENSLQNGDQIAISAITLVEMVYLIEKGRIAAESFSRLARIVEDADSAIVLVPVDLKIARTLSVVDGKQIPDMPDRIIAATALAIGVPVISRDARISMSTLTTIW